MRDSGQLGYGPMASLACLVGLGAAFMSAGIFVESEADWWRGIVFAVVAVLFVSISIPLFLRRNWARLVFLVVIDCLLVALVVLTILFAVSGMEEEGLSLLFGSIGMMLIPIAGVVALVMAVHSESRWRLRLRRRADGQGSEGQDPCDKDAH